MAKLLLIAAGGTGGHMFPAQALAEMIEMSRHYEMQVRAMNSADELESAAARLIRTEGQTNDSNFDRTSPTFGFIIDSPGVTFTNEAVYALVGARAELAAKRAGGGHAAPLRQDGVVETLIHPPENRHDHGREGSTAEAVAAATGPGPKRPPGHRLRTFSPHRRRPGAAPHSGDAGAAEGPPRELFMPAAQQVVRRDAHDEERTHDKGADQRMREPID
ncbi:MAG: hypothetical protein HC783_12845 [Rhodobacteraceae bacterium]|nr:hypothetical protein [Paracoccaceae bacterium]